MRTSYVCVCVSVCVCVCVCVRVSVRMLKHRQSVFADINLQIADFTLNPKLSLVNLIGTFSMLTQLSDDLKFTNSKEKCNAQGWLKAVASCLVLRVLCTEDLRERSNWNIQWHQWSTIKKYWANHYCVLYLAVNVSRSTIVILQYIIFLP